MANSRFHDDACEAEFIHAAYGWTPCDCAKRRAEAEVEQS